MLLELHCHSSKHSDCSVVDPVTLVRQVVKKHLQGIVITEHCYLWGEEEIKQLRRDAEVEDNFLIMAGQEAETDIGHVLVFGADRSIEDKISLEQLRKTFPEAALVWAHPFRGGARPEGRELKDPRLDAVEIFNNNQTVEENYLGLAAWHRHKFTAIGGTDTHDGVVAGKFPTQLDHPVENIEGLVKEIKKARCRPFFKEIPKAGTNIVVTEITLGTKGEDEARDRVILKSFQEKAKWKKLESSIEIMEKLHKKGFGEGAYRIPKIIDVKKKDMMLIEEGQRGRKLYDLLLRVDPSVGKRYLEHSAKWLAKFHNAGLKVSPREDTVKKEIKRFDSYLRSFTESSSPYTENAREMIAFVRGMETGIFDDKEGLFVQNHGDYHPKNIIIGQDIMQDISTMFVSVIDFDNSLLFNRAFDAGYFLAQFRSQYFSAPEVIERYPEKLFIEAYLEEAECVERDLFTSHLTLFKIRANLSIASFLIKVGKGESDEMRALMAYSTGLLKN